MRLFRSSALILLALLSAPLASAQDRRAPPNHPGRAESASEAKPADNPPHGAGVLRLLPPDAANEKVLSLGGRKFARTPTAGTLALFDQNGEQIAAVCSTAYVTKASDPSRPPLYIPFIGAPDAASP